MISRDNVEIKLQDLKPYANNARTHSPEQVAQIVAAMREWGFTNPILIDEDNGIIAGHGRALAAGVLKMETVPAVRLTGLSAAQKRALVISDNKLALNAGWDSDLLALELKGLSEMGFSLDLTGFSKIEVGRITGLGLARAGEDEVPAPPAVPLTVLGDMWLLGAHRVKCGDSTSATDVAEVMGEDKPLLMVTDPPYGVEYDANWRNKAERADGTKIGASAIGKVENDARADWREAWALFPGNIAYVWHADKFSPLTAESLQACGFILRNLIIWAKNQLAISRGDYHHQHEPCWYAVKNKGSWTGDRKQSTLWEIDKPRKSETGHSTQKPVECMRRPIVNNSAPGDFIYDPFLGSGTTLIAAEATSRICLGLELNPVYVDVIVKRWQDFTGMEAVHAITGEKFNS